MAGKVIAVDVTAAGSVEWHEQDEAGTGSRFRAQRHVLLEHMCSMQRLVKDLPCGCVGAELASSGNGAGKKAPKRKIKVEVPKWCGKWVVTMDQYKDGVVGAKSKNIGGRTFLCSTPALLPLLPGAALRIPYD